MEKHKKKYLGFLLFIFLITLYILGGSISYKGLFYYYIGKEEKAIDYFFTHGKEGRASRGNIEKLISLYTKQKEYEKLFNLLPELAFHQKYHKPITEFLLEHAFISVGKEDFDGELPSVLVESFNLPPLSLEKYFLDEFSRDIIRLSLYIDDPKLYKLYRRAYFLLSDGVNIEHIVNKYPIDEIDELAIGYYFENNNFFLENVPEKFQELYNYILYSWLYFMGTSINPLVSDHQDLLETFVLAFNTLDQREQITFLKILFPYNNFSELAKYLDMPEARLLSAISSMKSLYYRDEGIKLLDELYQEGIYSHLIPSLRNKNYLDFFDFNVTYDDILIFPDYPRGSHYFMYDIERDKYIEFVDSQFRYHTSSLKWSPKGNYVIATSYDNSLSIFEYTNPNKKSSKYMSSYGSLSFDVYERHDIFKEIYVIENVHPFESYRWFSEKEFFYKSTENDELYLFDISTKHGRPIEEKYIKEKLQETEERQSAKFQYYFKEVPLEKPLGIYILYRKNLITGQEEELPFFTVKYIF